MVQVSGADHGESLNPRKPFQTPFLIKNDGYLPIYNINYNITLDKMEDINHNKFMNCSFSFQNNIEQLRANKSSAIWIDRAVATPPDFIKYAEVYLNVTYRPFLVPFTFTENIRFKTATKENGEYIWLESYSK